METSAEQGKRYENEMVSRNFMSWEEDSTWVSEGSAVAVKARLLRTATLHKDSITITTCAHTVDKNVFKSVERLCWKDCLAIEVFTGINYGVIMLRTGMGTKVSRNIPNQLAESLYIHIGSI